MFEKCTNLIIINLNGINTENLINISKIFSQCKNLKEINLSFLSNAEIDDLSGLFYQCESLENINFEKINLKKLQNYQVYLKNVLI